MGLVFLLLFFVFVIHAEGVFSNNVSIKVMEEELHMSWVSLEEGGYSVVGVIPEELKLQNFTCKFLTDLTPEEIAERIKEQDRLPYRLEVKSLNAIVEVNGGVFLADPFMPGLNPTAIANTELLLTIAEVELLKLVRKDESVRETYRRLYRQAMEDGLSEREAKLFALRSLIGKVKIKRWVPEESLPDRLYLYCRRELWESKGMFMPPSRRIMEVRLYPVRLSVKKHKEIKVLEVKVLEGDIEVLFEIAYRGKAPRTVPLDLITLNPPKAEGAGFKGVKNVYVGGYLYYGFGKDPNRLSYVVFLSYHGEGFYTILSHQSHTNRYRLYIRLGYYGSNEEREEISLLNPAQGDKSYTNTIVYEGYTHRKFLQELGLDLPVELTFKIISPEGYSSEPFKVIIR